MKLINYLFLVNQLFAYANVQFFDQPVSLIMDGEILFQPFSGGLNSPQVQWVNWDDDIDNELFILDEDSCVRLYDYVNLEQESFFRILDTNFGDLCYLNWFQFVDIDLDGELEFVTQVFNSSNQIQVYEILVDELFLVGTIMQSNGSHVISDSVMVPTFADIDSDGDYDFFTGNIIGTVTMYENVGLSENGIPEYDLISFEWQNIWIVGPSMNNRHGASAIQFVDIDSDGDLDLCWGDYFQASLYIIFNLGSPENPLMDISNIVTEFPYNDSIYTTGRNMPSFNDIDLDGDLDLFISVLGGDGGIQLADNFLFYKNSDGIFSLESTNFMSSVDLNSNVVPELVDIDSDGDLDLFLGQDYNTASFPIRGRIYFFRNIGDNTFQLENDEFMGTDIGNSLHPVFEDIDSDGDLDLFIGNYNGTIMFYENIGNESIFEYVYISDIPNVDIGSYSAPAFEDIDLDGDLDLFVGENYGKLFFYENIGDQVNFNFSLKSDNYSNIDTGYRSSVVFFDLNLDGQNEILLGSNNQGVQVYNKLPSNNNVVEFQLNECVDFPYLGLNTKPKMYFANQDLLALSGVSTGGLYQLKYEQHLLGDVNQDSFLNIQDVLSIVNHIVDSENIIDYCYADVNYDSYVDLLDVLLIVVQISD